MKIGVIGINHRLAELKLREELAKIADRYFGHAEHFHGHHAFVLLSTCNRTEIYFSSEDLSQTHTYILTLLRNHVEEEFDQKLYSFFDRDCMFHLFRVTSGLDSAIVGETEIQGQVKKAYQETSQYSFLSSDLHYLFQKALRVGKQVRSSHPFHQWIHSLESAVFKLSGETSHLFYGASATNRKIIQYLKGHGVTNIALCNRTNEKALLMARQENIEYLPWEKRFDVENFKCLIFGTKAPQPILTASDIEKVHGKKLVIDLSVPRNVEPELALNPQITLVNIDHLHRNQKRRQKKLIDLVANAEDVVEDFSVKYRNLFYRKTAEKLIVG